MRIGIFGGSFDPIHNDHVAICEKFYKSLNLDKVIVMPAGQSPFKNGYSVSANQRKEMIDLAFKDYPFVTVSDYELKQKGKSYTCLTIDYINQTHQNDELFMLIGLDSFATFLNWKNPNLILDKCQLAVFYREGFNFEFEEQKFIKATGKSICKLYHNGKASSTYIREQLKLGIYSEEFLPKSVCEYIKANELYRGDVLYGAVTKRLSSKRLFHTAGVISTAISYAKKLDENIDNARIASLLHDIAKHEKVENYPQFQMPIGVPEAVVHQYLGAYIAQTELSINDENVLNAIRYHTTGRPGMSTLEKIVFIADLLEPSRDYAEVDELRTAVNENFENGFKLCLKRLVNHLEKGNGEIFDLTLKTNAFYNGEK